MFTPLVFHTPTIYKHDNGNFMSYTVNVVSCKDGTANIIIENVINGDIQRKTLNVVNGYHRAVKEAMVFRQNQMMYEGYTEHANRGVI